MKNNISQEEIDKIEVEIKYITEMLLKYGWKQGKDEFSFISPNTAKEINIYGAYFSLCTSLLKERGFIEIIEERYYGRMINFSNKNISKYIYLKSPNTNIVYSYFESVQIVENEFDETKITLSENIIAFNELIKQLPNETIIKTIRCPDNNWNLELRK